MPDNRKTVLLYFVTGFKVLVNWDQKIVEDQSPFLQLTEANGHPILVNRAAIAFVRMGGSE